MPYVANESPETRSPPTVNSQFACVIDATRGIILYTKNHMDGFGWPASTVKIMTALIAAERKAGSLSSTITFQTSDDLPSGFSQADLANGDVFSWIDGIHTIMRVSAGDVCQTFARVIGNEIAGRTLTSTLGYADFVAEMNNRASLIGVTRNCNFVNSHGGNGPPEFSMCARDLCFIASACFGNSDILSVFATSSHNFQVTAGPNPRTIVMNYGGIYGSTGYQADKNGALILPGLGVETYSLTSQWTAPNGNRIVMATMNATTGTNRNNDHLNMYSALTTDFPYLAA